PHQTRTPAPPTLALHDALPISNTNALVSVSQRGARIYQTTVPPGAFRIDDLYPNGTGGDLLVTIKEADGSEHSFTVTYASIAELDRKSTRLNSSHVKISYAVFC